VDALETTGRYEPGAWIGRDAIARPLLQRCAKGIVQRLLGDIEVAEQPNQCGKDAARFGAVDGVHRVTGLFGHSTYASFCVAILHLFPATTKKLPGGPFR